MNLLPCPFCGAPPDVIGVTLHECPAWMVRCADCRAGRASTYIKTDAVRLWNTRPGWISAESMARRFHEIYESQSKAFGYTTRDDTKEFDPNSPNGRLMIFTCAQMLKGPDAVM